MAVWLTPQGKRVVPYFDRAQIDVNALTATSSLKPLAWVDDVVEAFFLQIQGSGLIELADGSRMRVGYADQNGHPFRGVGRILVDRGDSSSKKPACRASRAGSRAIRTARRHC